MAQVQGNLPEAVLRDMQEVLRQLRAAGHAEVSASSTGLITATADNVWRDDPLVYTDVFVRNGGLRVDAGGLLTSSAGARLSYGWRLYTVTTGVDPDGGSVEVETLYRDATYQEAVEVTGGTVAASRASRVNGLPTGTYRVRGAHRLAAGTGTITNRSLIAIPR
jgi:hypothetical protein